ncbi:MULTISPECIES: methylmalonyl-CoA mutase family protein [Pseudonocardia]|uniref:methylmalonyl-CoA mutase n=2 Tax=Pseudonocardia TaxID=1847 RepID=A0A1Y2N6N5_PSEAH|nr:MULTISPECIES: methylmalonyl-CoA mutase family protein [Pseudonocardia]OSY43136.1 Methylmalonyl-CoA mutase small subunit [Pseudonocardia autotrophica]TDN71624.1 heterodimeric methylmalonyl-CoA mutase small subunit [Pseudonocardia autotrophica]BBG02311.1 methylmalonyl-CoA mutase [Pseudonocardia autotrophica]GEC23353.1 methylmalonyl-CoA mutase [Pseudonocardia saturnea]
MTGSDRAAVDAGDGPAEPDELVLAGGFDPVTREQWTAAVDSVVRRSGRIGEDADPGAGVDALTRTSADGIRVAPLYASEDVEDVPATGVPGAWPFTRGALTDGHVPGGWDIRQRHVGTDPAAVREALLADLECGVNSIWLRVGDGGIPVAELPAAVEGVYLDLAPIALDADADAVEAGTAYLDLAARNGVEDADLLGSLGADPIGLRARTGSGPEAASVVELARRVATSFPQVTAVTVDARVIREAGGSDAQELGWSLAAGVGYLRALVEGGLDVAAAARVLEFRYAATPEQFPTIAKLRAARRLWSRVLEASGTTDVPQRQHAVVSEVLFSRRDPWVNMLRGTVAGFAAGVGGADAVTVPPFDAAIGSAEPFSRRIARNTQNLLVEESHLGRVIDPAGGSWYVEHLTDDLARVAWEFFQAIEAAGGAVAALDSGLVAERVAEVRARRETDVARRKTPLTGVSEFPNLDEKPVVREPLPAPVARGGLPLYRPAEAYESQRDRSDAVLERDGRRPTVFLATIGPLAGYTARAGFTRNLLGAGGIDAAEAGPTDTAEAVAEAYRAGDRPAVAVLCSSDALYDERAADTAAALREAGATRILLAGKPKDPVQGVDGYLFAGCDALAVIDDVHTSLEGST